MVPFPTRWPISFLLFVAAATSFAFGVCSAAGTSPKTAAQANSHLVSGPAKRARNVPQDTWSKGAPFVPVDRGELSPGSANDYRDERYDGVWRHDAGDPEEPLSDRQ